MAIIVMEKKKKVPNVMIDKDVRVVVNLGNLTIKYTGVLKDLGDWVLIKTEEGTKMINKNDCILIEELK